MLNMDESADLFCSKTHLWDRDNILYLLEADTSSLLICSINTKFPLVQGMVSARKSTGIRFWPGRQTGAEAPGPRRPAVQEPLDDLVRVSGEGRCLEEVAWKPSPVIQGPRQEGSFDKTQN